MSTSTSTTRKICSPRSFLFLLATACGANLALADVRIVAADGSGDFVQIQDAINSSTDGDVLLVRPGNYPGFSIADKSLTVTAELGQGVNINGTVRILSLAQQRTVLLSNLDVTGNFDFPDPLGHGLSVENCQGPVRAQDCTFRGYPTYLGSGPFGREGASLNNSADLVFTRCEFYGGNPGSLYDCCAPGGPGGHGIRNNASVLALYDCHAEGHEGGYSGHGGHGGHGVLQNGPALYASGCTFVGGKGGYGDDFVFGPGGNGGDALRAATGSSSVLVETQLVPGEPGDSFLGSPGAQPGAPVGGNGAVSLSPGPSRHFSSQILAWTGNTHGILIEGEPGDRVRIVASSATDYAYRANVNGVWVPQLPSLTQPQILGGSGSTTVTLPSSGRLTVGVEVPFPGGNGLAGSWYLQGLVISASGTRHLTSPAMVTRLQCGFSTDCNGNGTPDGCDISGGTSPDCNLNGIPDECDFNGTEPDCNGNGVPDVCDITGGSSGDCNLDEIPDECQIDCNANGIPDDCDVTSGTSADCDGDLIPDECSIDCNTNGVPDLCDISAGTSLDVNGNGVPDECQSPGDTYFVDAAGVPWGDGSPGLPFNTIGQAADYVISGNTIVVLDGTYTGTGNRDVSFGGNDLVLRSQNGAANCIVDLEQAGRAIHLSGGETQAARIEGITFRNGSNTLGTGGTAILVDGANPTIVDCVFEGNNSTSLVSGALRFQGSLAAGSAGARVLTSNFTGNSGGRGGGIASEHDAGRLLIQDCSFSGNDAMEGAAIYLGGIGSETLVQGADIRGNTMSYGGAIFQRQGHLGITESIIAENVGGFGGGIHVGNGDSFRMGHTILAANVATNSQGGGLALLDYNDSMLVRIDNCLVFGNTADSIGGGMVLRDANDMEVTNCSFFLNEGSQGGGLWIGGSGTHLIRNSMFWENTASQAGPQILVSSSSLAPATTDIDYCSLQDGINGILTAPGGALNYGTNNSSVYPGFVDPDGPDNDITTWEDNDVHLGPNSPARDAGDNTYVRPDTFDLDGDGDTLEPVPFDLAGDLRQVDSNEPDTGNGAAPIVDLGCYEDQ